MFPIFSALLALVGAASAAQPATSVPPADHVVVVIMENHSYDQVRTLPYTADLMATQTAFAASYAITHPSQPNYIALWSGGTQGVANDACPAPGSPFFTENLGHACETAGLSWRSYSEDLPSVGYTGCTAAGGLYVRKHCPWTNFANVDHSNERPFTDLATDLALGSLPNLAVVIPNQCHNTHDCSVGTGDTWLSEHLPDMIDGLGPSGFLVLTWDEDDSHSGNHILTVFAGPLVKSGYLSPTAITHYTVLRTICDALALTPFGAAINETPITDCWRAPTGAPSRESSLTWTLGPVYPNPSAAGIEAQLSFPSALAFDGPRPPFAAEIYDAAGRSAAILAIDPRAAGERLHWNGRQADGRRAPAGLYFLRVRAGNTRLERKFVLVNGSSR